MMKCNREYLEFIDILKEKIKATQIKTTLNVSTKLIELYWYIGKKILVEQNQRGWGHKIIDQLAFDLSQEFSEMKGFSVRNLKYMRKFAYIFPDGEFVQQVVAQIPWGHNLVLMNKIDNEDEYLWYAKQTIMHGWSRSILMHQMELNLYKRQSKKKISNFQATLPKPQSDLAEQTLKDPYIFDFLSIGKDVYEREIEKELTKHIRKFLLELGSGFAFVGNQYHLEIEGEDYYIDMLFYHLKLRCYVVVELKAKHFKPEYAGKLNFYLSAIDDKLKNEHDNPTIGIILCKDKGGKVKGEYALRGVGKPIGLAEYEIVESIPKELKTDLPTIEELEEELSQDLIAAEHLIAEGIMIREDE
ncbi:MAG: DUF1016 domain-containing protein [Rickettsiales bacterium]|nr:DUF1016 domain-containing protein [Rickettsiales bacterium]